MEPSFERIAPPVTEDTEPISEQRLAIREPRQPVEAAVNVARSQEEALRRDVASLDHLDLIAKITAALGLSSHFASSMMNALPEFKAQIGLTDNVVDHLSSDGIAVAALAVGFSLISSGLKASLNRRAKTSHG